MTPSQKNIQGFLTAISQMIRIAWGVSPLIFIASLSLRAIHGLVPIIIAWITKQIFDFLAALENYDIQYILQRVLPLLLIQTVVTIASQAIGAANVFLSDELSRKTKLKAQSIVYERIASLDGLSPFESSTFYDTIGLASQGIQSGPGQMLAIFTTLFQNFITLTSFLGVLIFISPVLGIITLLASIPQLIMQLRINSRRMRTEINNISKERKASYLSQLLTNVNFAKEIQIFRTGKYILDKFLKIVQEIQGSQRNHQIHELRIHLTLDIFSNLISSGAFIIVILQASLKRISLGDVTFYMNALRSVQGSLTGIVASFARMNELVLFYSHFIDLMNLPSTLYISPSPQPISPLSYGIEFRNVSFRYSEKHAWTLKDVSFLLPQGQCLALVGLNGAGKTTLVKLLCRFYDPSEGQILWDGVDIREYDINQYRTYLGAIFQDFARYDLTARENIGFGNITELNNIDLIRRAAKMSRIDDYLESLTDGYETLLSRWMGENGIGVDLSGGQWQKIAMARLLVSEAEVLILDEPTSALDAQAEQEIYDHFINLTSKHTTLLISHRFSTVKMADIIVVLEDGKLIEYGSHQDLIFQNKTYAYLYNMQAEKYVT